MQLIIFEGCVTCPFTSTDILGADEHSLRIEHSCSVTDDRVMVSSDDLATEPPSVPPRWCPMRLTARPTIPSSGPCRCRAPAG